MTWYRRYKALYDFEARGPTELTMSCEDTLLVERLSDGTWPPAEKWMQGYNELTAKSGEFPGGAYVEFVEEFLVEPKARSPPPPAEPDPPRSFFPPQPSPRHHSMPNVDNNRRPISPIGRAEEEEEAPPPPPRRGMQGRMSDSNITPSQGSLPPQAPPRPKQRKRSGDSATAREREAMSPVNSPSHAPIPEMVERHRWSRVTFSIPVQCAACK